MKIVKLILLALIVFVSVTGCGQESSSLSSNQNNLPPLVNQSYDNQISSNIDTPSKVATAFFDALIKGEEDVVKKYMCSEDLKYAEIVKSWRLQIQNNPDQVYGFTISGEEIKGNVARVLVKPKAVSGKEYLSGQEYLILENGAWKMARKYRPDPNPFKK